MKRLWLFSISFVLFNLFISNIKVNALSLDDLSKYSEIKGYCQIKNINNIPLSVKIEQMLFLNWDINDLNYTELLDYLKIHNIGGISLSVKTLSNNKQNLENLISSIKNLYALPNFHTIPYFININYNSEVNNEQNIKLISSLGANIINIDANIDTKVEGNLNNKNNYNNLFEYVKNCNKNSIIVSINKFKNPFYNESEVNIYGWLIKKGKFNQIIIPDNYNDPKIDNKHYYSLSKIAIYDNIRNKLRFSGIVLNTSLASKNIRNKYTINQVVIDAITSGNNMIYYNGSSLENNKKFVEQVVNTITIAINDGIISINDINESYVKVINLKSQFSIIPRENYC